MGFVGFLLVLPFLLIAAGIYGAWLVIKWTAIVGALIVEAWRERHEPPARESQAKCSNRR